MNKLILLLLTVICFPFCKKEAKTVFVSYKIVETTSYAPTYTVRYTLADGTTKSLGGLTKSTWVSEKIVDVETGKYLSLSVEGSGSGAYQMFIYINGYLVANREADNTNGAQTLETQISY